MNIFGLADPPGSPAVGVGTGTTATGCLNAEIVVRTPASVVLPAVKHAKEYQHLPDLGGRVRTPV